MSLSEFHHAHLVQMHSLHAYNYPLYHTNPNSSRTIQSISLIHGLVKLHPSCGLHLFGLDATIKRLSELNINRARIDQNSVLQELARETDISTKPRIRNLTWKETNPRTETLTQNHQGQS